MARVYISSSYSDLREERQLVSEIISQLGHDAVGMESYRANEAPPLDFCVRDVQNSSHYVGIFAFRYGTAVKGKSITEWEYEAAGEKGIPRFIFTLKNGAAWQTDRVDPDRSQIDALRKRLQDPLTGHLVQEFKDAGELAAQLRKVVEVDIGRGEQFPSILPFLCDRGAQRDQLIDALKLRGRPLVCVIHGDEKQAHDRFLDRLRDHILPEILASGASRPAISAFHVQWPARAKDRSQATRSLVRNLASGVRLAVDSSVQDIHEHLRQFPTPVMIWANYRADDWDEGGLRSIESFLDLWGQWPELDLDERLMVFLMVKYPRETRRLFALKLWNKTAQIEAALQGFHQKVENAHCCVLDRLPDITHQETEDWARMDEVANYRPTHLLLQDIQRIYAQWRLRSKSAEIPMEELAEELRVCLQNGRKPNTRIA
jgi:hypothetical protein